MPIHLGEFFLAQNQPNDAIAAYERALTAFPNDHQALRGLEKAFLSAKLPEKAEATRKTLDRLLAP
jgi:cytochrome c-type biogenesis protein CcmH/NrfG